jgi:hypothetical protein
MRNARRKFAFVLAASDHGTMIVNRLDYHMIGRQAVHKNDRNRSVAVERLTPLLDVPGVRWFSPR